MDINVDLEEVLDHVALAHSDFYVVEWPEWEAGVAPYFTVRTTEAGASQYGDFTLTMTLETLAKALRMLSEASAETYQQAWASALLTVPNFTDYLKMVDDELSTESFIIFALTHLGEEKHTTTEGK